VANTNNQLSTGNIDIGNLPISYSLISVSTLLAYKFLGKQQKQRVKTTSSFLIAKQRDATEAERGCARMDRFVLSVVTVVSSSTKLIFIYIPMRRQRM